MTLGVCRSRAGERGAVLLLAVVLIAVLLVIGVAVLRIAGGDRVDAAQQGAEIRARACAEAGLQYGRRFFGCKFESTHGWNDYLDDTSATYVAGYRYDPGLGDEPGIDGRPAQARGKSNGTDFDAGADLNGDGNPDFWVSIRDDDDERSQGLGDNPRHDNNEKVILRSECTMLGYGERGEHAVVEAVFTHVQSRSDYANAQITSNSPDVIDACTGM